MKTNKQLLLGAHISVAGGYEKSFERAASIGCSTMQIFTKSNRQWQAKPITPEQENLFKKTKEKFAIAPLVSHASYLINLGSPDSALRAKSIKALADELKRCSQLGLDYLVVHPGSHLKSGEDACLESIAQSLDAVLENDTGSTMILLETMAGQGSSVCYDFAHIEKIRKLSRHKDRLGVCLDTCHIFAAGYDFRTTQTYQAVWQEFDRIIGLKHLKVIHVNDSKKELGSRVDRHASIGKGEIGQEGFRLLFNDPRFFDTPKILETPEGTLEDFARDIATIKKLLSPTTRSTLNLK